VQDGKHWLRDEKGMNAGIAIADVYQSNAVIHVIDSVLMPKRLSSPIIVHDERSLRAAARRPCQIVARARVHRLSLPINLW
jgi:hypothetical protein